VVVFVWVGRKNGFVWYFLVCGGGEGPRLNGRELHAGSIVERGKGVVGGRAFVFNGKWGNVGVTETGGRAFHAGASILLPGLSAFVSAGFEAIFSSTSRSRQCGKTGGKRRGQKDGEKDGDSLKKTGKKTEKDGDSLKKTGEKGKDGDSLS
jgi:type IV secretory pathway TrbL component